MAAREPGLIAADFFDATAAEYGRRRHRSFYRGIVLDLLGMLPASFRPDSILEIGAGCGFATEAITEWYPGAEITAIEPAAEMLIQGMLRAPAANWRNQTLSGYSGTGADLVVCSMTYHWLLKTEREQMCKLAASGLMAAAIPVTGGLPLNGNKALLNQLPRTAVWPRQLRKPAFLDGFLKSRFPFISSKDVQISESFKSVEDMAASLYARGALQALFGEAAAEARERLEGCRLKEPEFNWKIRLFLASHRKGWLRR